MDHLRVLVVDNSLVIRAMIEQIIGQDPGCRVIGLAADAPSGHQMMTDLLPNLVILDLDMPGPSGMDFLEELRGHTHPPIVIVSSLTKEGSAAAKSAIDCGARACFDKARIVSDRDLFMQILKTAARRVPKGTPTETQPPPGNLDMPVEATCN
jgi:two-component system chemotaxis response regulator CheB